MQVPRCHARFGDSQLFDIIDNCINVLISCLFTFEMSKSKFIQLITTKELVIISTTGQYTIITDCINCFINNQLQSVDYFKAI